MIEFEIVPVQTDLFDKSTSDYVSPNIVVIVRNLATKTEMEKPAPRDKFEYTKWMFKMVRSEIYQTIKGMWSTRDYASNSGYPMASHKLYALDMIKEYLDMISAYKTPRKFFCFVYDRILFFLEEASPNPNSKQYESYQRKIDMLKDFLRYEVAQNQKYNFLDLVKEKAF